ncbi:MAG: response regulator [Porphyromonadaceae bacterium]|nr:MAG: response regulator [Porphyromonadaceae bacterium]
MDWSNKTILIAEDEDSNYLYLEAVLQKTGASLLWARSGEETIDACKQNPKIDLILMDLQMPNINGYEARFQIKSMFPNIHQIAQTAFAMADDEKRAMDAGFDAYIAKPIRKGNLLTIVGRFLGPLE